MLYIRCIITIYTSVYVHDNNTHMRFKRQRVHHSLRPVVTYVNMLLHIFFIIISQFFPVFVCVCVCVHIYTTDDPAVCSNSNGYIIIIIIVMCVCVYALFFFHRRIKYIHIGGGRDIWNKILHLTRTVYTTVSRYISTKNRANDVLRHYYLIIILGGTNAVISNEGGKYIILRVMDYAIWNGERERRFLTNLIKAGGKSPWTWRTHTRIVIFFIS